MRYHILKDNRPANFEKQAYVVVLYKENSRHAFVHINCIHFVTVILKYVFALYRNFVLNIVYFFSSVLCEQKDTNPVYITKNRGVTL